MVKSNAQEYMVAAQIHTHIQLFVYHFDYFGNIIELKLQAVLLIYVHNKFVTYLLTFLSYLFFICVEFCLVLLSALVFRFM